MVRGLWTLVTPGGGRRPIFRPLRDHCLFISSQTAEADETPCQSSRNEAVDVSHYPKPVGLLQLPLYRTAVVDHSPV